VSAHSLAFRTRGGIGDGASGRGRGASDNPRCGGGRARIGGRGALGDHLRLRGRPWVLPRPRNRPAPAGERRSGSETSRKREEHALKFPSHQRLTRDGGRAWFALSTPTSTGRGCADGGTLKFFCGLAPNGGSVLRIFSLPNCKLAIILRIEVGWRIC
jgi:hypothetical protein